MNKIFSSASFRNNGIGRRLIVALILFSSIITAFTTAFELFLDYRADIHSIESRLQFIENSYLPTLVESVWVADGAQIQTQLDGLARLQDVEYLLVRIDQTKHWQAGVNQSSRQIKRSIPLVRQYRGEPVNIGTLEIFASVDNVIVRLWDKLLVVLISNAVKTLLVATFLLLVFQFMVGRHLERIALYVRDFGKPETQASQPLQLDRPATGRWRPDALDHVTHALNDARQLIATNYAQVNDLYQSIITASMLGIGAYRANGDCVLANAALANIVGATPEQVMAKNFRTLSSWKHSGIDALANDALQNNQSRSGEFHVTSSFGKQIWIAVHLSPFLRAGEQHLLLIIMDISARKQAEQLLRDAIDRAEQANLAKSRFLSNMSHELRTPMNAILGFSQILHLENLQPEQHDFVMEIDRAGTHLLELINELLDLSRIESGKITIQIQAVNLSQIMLDTNKLVEALVAEKNLTLRNTCDSRAMVLADPVRLKQIIVNLLSNAAKYNRPGGSIVLACQALSDTRLRLSVTDTGPGIAPEKIPKLFTLFERLGAENSTIEGTGIGLALSKQLAALMNTELGVDSTPGKGSTFWIDLNTAAATPSSTDVLPTTSAPATAQTARHKILYVEDNAANLRVVEAMFRHTPSMTLLSATNGEYGLELAQRYVPDVILLDIHLPGMDGYAVLNALQINPSTRNIPVIALSADAMPLDIERGLKAGFNAYLTKPIRLNELMHQLKLTLGNQHAATNQHQK